MNGKIKDCTELKEFTKVSLTEACNRIEKEKIHTYWSKALSVDEFKSLILNDEELSMTQSYAEVSKETHGHSERLLKQAQEVIYTDSDRGGVKVGNDSFSFVVPNGIGDGTTKVMICHVKQFNHDMARYFTTIKGKFNIYSYDCGNNIETTLEGTYSIYYYKGITVLAKE